MVVFGFLSPNFGRWWGPLNGTLAFYECRFSGGDTMRRWGHSNLTLCKRIYFNFLRSQVAGTQKLWASSAWPSLMQFLAPGNNEPPGGI